ncbi:MAG TPA: aspartate kinase [Thermomicrobiales bacterium]|nr:aspartate kinase [Thermomicrobiales bacterium]
MIVLKFGGTSVGSLERVREAAAIAAAQPAPRAVVVSAASGVTNLLLEAGRQAARGDRGGMAATVATIVGKHQAMLEGLPTGPDRTETANRIEDLHTALELNLADVTAAGDFSARLSDRIVATGEKVMSLLMAATLRSMGFPAEAVFADRVIGTDGRYGAARPDRDRTREQADAIVRPILDEGKTVVMTGFIGGAPDGTTTTLGRGGSDYSATLLGAALHADEVQIWTDVPGVLSADPRLVSGAREVPQLGFEEAQELAHFGAKVLHPRTIRPAVALDIPVRILSTFAPYEPGTRVTRESSSDDLKAVTLMKNLILLTVDVPELEDLSGAASVVFGALYEDRTEVVLAAQASSRRRMTYLIEGGNYGGCNRVCARLEDVLRDYEVEIGCTEDVAILAAVGQGAADQTRALSRMLGVLQREGVPVLASNQQMSNVAMVAAVPQRFADRGLLAIHDEFIGSRPSGAKLRRQRRSRLLAEPVQVG